MPGSLLVPTHGPANDDPGGWAELSDFSLTQAGGGVQLRRGIGGNVEMIVFRRRLVWCALSVPFVMALATPLARSARLGRRNRSSVVHMADVSVLI
jgi:hypothetical protein